MMKNFYVNIQMCTLTIIRRYSTSEPERTKERKFGKEISKRRTFGFEEHLELERHLSFIRHLLLKKSTRRTATNGGMDSMYHVINVYF
ncbi:hypothetical protein M9Y10_013255 [Tritrichomonas musculus]|uniref:Uncharacterized protein n=1 Tax=Tritrichomonas musculus TaxID=1915356 RepID=A0ABR2I6K2_9EUKA